MILTFDREHLKRLLATSKAATERSPVLEQLYDPQYRKDGKVPAADAFPKPDEIDPNKIPPGLILVGDHGVYLLSNAHVELPQGGKHDVAYALEANPTKLAFDDWWDAKNRSFGGDDGSEFIEHELIEKWLASKRGKHVKLALTPRSMRFL